jgi:hypothetical protein
VPWLVIVRCRWGYGSPETSCGRTFWSGLARKRWRPRESPSAPSGATTPWSRQPHITRYPASGFEQTAEQGGGWEDRGYPRETLNLFLNQAAGRTPQRATGQAIAAAVLRPRTRPESGPSRGTPCIEANRHDATPAPFDRHMPNIARVYPRVLPPESNSPPPQFPSVRRPSGSGYVHRGAWAIPRSRALGAIPTLEARGDPRG